MKMPVRTNVARNALQAQVYSAEAAERQADALERIADALEALLAFMHPATEADNGAK